MADFNLAVVDRQTAKFSGNTVLIITLGLMNRDSHPVTVVTSIDFATTCTLHGQINQSNHCSARKLELTYMVYTFNLVIIIMYVRWLRNYCLRGPRITMRLTRVEMLHCIAMSRGETRRDTTVSSCSSSTANVTSISATVMDKLPFIWLAK